MGMVLGTSTTACKGLAHLSQEAQSIPSWGSQSTAGAAISMKNHAHHILLEILATSSNHRRECNQKTGGTHKEKLSVLFHTRADQLTHTFLWGGWVDDANHPRIG